MKPNILLIHADQHRYDCLGLSGNSDVKTPNIDSLAAEGVTYTNSYCSYPVCTPSRYSLISGVYPHQHLGWTNHCTMLPTLDTFPRILRDSGYRTKAVGKMHFTPTYLNVGFQEMVLAEQNGPGRYEDDYHRYLLEKGLVDRIDLMDQEQEYRVEAPAAYWDTFGALESNLTEKDHSSTWIGDRAVDTVRNWSDSGNCLMVGFIKPHHPFDPPAPWSDMYNPDKLELLPGWTPECLEKDLAKNAGYFSHLDLTEQKLRRMMAYYYASISQIDHQIGRLIQVLKQKRIYENTMILYTSDHGDYLGFHHLALKQNYMYDPLIKVPLVIKYPGRSNKEISDKLVNNVDLAPSILAQAGCSPGKYMNGIDLAATDQTRIHVFAEDRGGTDYMVRTQTQKLLLSKKDSDSQFFDLETDPLEMRNLYDEPNYQDQISAMKEALADWMLFQAPTPVYLDEYAATIRSENVLLFDPTRRDELARQVREKYRGE